MIINPNPDRFPAVWACDWGEDAYGYWQAFEVYGIRQVVRWIPPGRFLMGSPVQELRRESDEKLHPVILSQGYWLANTACTQFLWEVVMSKPDLNEEDEDEEDEDEEPDWPSARPSSSNECMDNPVEQVSWEGVNIFLNELNGLVLDLKARLPTEAQWEYACRAGTTTPFSWGNLISTDQANYNGNHLDGFCERESWRKETILVNEFPVNSWGLYQMHGNVWEWCQDWKGDYASEEQIDPVGPPSGKYRIARGGSWDEHANKLRSAYRQWLKEDSRIYDLGFRFVIG